MNCHFRSWVFLCKKWNPTVSCTLFRDRTIKMDCADISSWHALYRKEKWWGLVNRTNKLCF